MEAERNTRRSFAAYADDLSVVLEADDEDSLLRDIKGTVVMIRNWFQNIGLQLNIGKCHVLTFQGTRIFPGTMIPLTAGTSIKVVNKVKILGLIIDRRLKFDDHVMSTINKLVPMRNAFFRLCPNTYGPDSRKRAIIYTQVYRAILTYGSEIWSNRITTQVRSKMVSFQHRFLVNVVQAYRTTSRTSVHTLSGVEPIDLFMKRKLMEFQAKDHTPGSDNPLTQLLLPNAPAHKRPIPEEIFFESPAEMAILSGKTKVLRTRRPRRTRRLPPPPPDQIQNNAAAVIDDQDELLVDPEHLPPLAQVSEQHYHLYISARCRQIRPGVFRLGTYYKLRTPTHDFVQGMKFYSFVDRRQSTQVALEHVLGLLIRRSIPSPENITIITDELEAARFLEMGRIKTNQTEHAIVGFLRSIRCNLLFRRPTTDDTTFRSVKREAVREARTSSREITFRVYNANFVRRSARNWTKAEFQTRYAKSSQEGGANPTMKGFFPRAADFPRWLTTNFVTIQFLTGHGKFRQYLTDRAQAMTDPRCPCDGRTVQSSKHVLLDCPNYSHITRRHFATAGFPLHCLMSLVELPQTTELFVRAAHEIHQALLIDNNTDPGPIRTPPPSPPPSPRPSPPSSPPPLAGQRSPSPLLLTP